MRNNNFKRMLLTEMCEARGYSVNDCDEYTPQHELASLNMHRWIEKDPSKFKDYDKFNRLYKMYNRLSF